MMMVDPKSETLSVVPVPDNDNNWKESVSIGGLVCFALCAV